ncbi:APC family permease [Rhodococcus sp. NPDC057529]|uniref:APC family permease n=1 Tax=Rhodococcus sp. NPDC057529 TaxID=3346158 RepID=UPI0036734410
MPEPTGQTEELRKAFTLRSAASLAFVFVSPIVGLYGVFALAIGAAGPAAFWAFVVVLVGQLFVAGVFGEMASRWPFEGSVYQWARRLGGESYGWFTGWTYMWSLIIAVAGGSYAVASFLPIVLGIEDYSKTTRLAVAMGFMCLTTLINIGGPKVVKVLVGLSLIAEVVGSIGLGASLLLFHREQSLSVLFETFGAGQGPGGYLWAGFFAATAFVGWGFVGFESAAAISEEVEDPRRNVPKAILIALVGVGAVVLFSALALILATPDMGAVVSGVLLDPTASTISAAYGDGITRPLFVLIIIGFIASGVAAQTSASRLIWSFARDEVLPGSTALRTLSGNDRVPRIAIAVSGGVGVVALLLASSDRIFETLVSFSTAGFFVAFALPVVAFVWMRTRTTYTPGPFSLGRFSWPVTTVAVVWLVFEVVNIAWPRHSGLPWYETYAVLVGGLLIGVLGIVIWFSKRDRIRAAGEDLDTHAEPREPITR